MAAGDEYDIDNYHIPETVDVKERAEEQIEADGNTPAWEL
jgi:hypothetical protein